MNTGNKINKSFFYRDTAFYIICFLIVFTPLARGAMHPWAITLTQIGLAFSVCLLFLHSIRFGGPVFEPAPLGRPLSALLLLGGMTALFSTQGLFAWEGFLLLVTYATAYWVTHTVVRTRKQQRIVVYVIISTALILAFIGLLKRFGMNPFVFWEYDELRYSPKYLAATFTNHNHMAGFLEMAIPFVPVLLLTKRRGAGAKFLIFYILFILLTTQVLTLSRGGWVSCIGALVFMLIVIASKENFNKGKLLLSFAGAGVVLSVFILSSTPVVERVMTLAEQDKATSMESRLIAWSGTIDMIKDHALTGVGPGVYQASFTQYQPAGLRMMFIQAHNDYLQVVAEFGVLAIPIVIWAIFLFFKKGIQNIAHPSRQIRWVSLAVMASFVAVLIHSILDFNMYIPANAVFFAISTSLLRQNEFVN